MKSKLVTTEQAAEYIGGDDKPLKTNTLEGWRVQGIGPRYIKIGRLVRYRVEDLDTFLEAHTRQSTSQAGVRS
jgi:hypothetical protein